MPELIIPDELITALTTNSCILFAGSGLSAGIPRSNGKPLPTWEGLLNELLEATQISIGDYQKINQAICEKEFQIAAHYIRQYAGNEGYYQGLRDIFTDPALKPGINHGLLVDLPFKAVLTTNYDTLLEDTFKAVHPELITLTHQDLKDFKHLLHHQNDEFFVVKLHGNIIEPETIVLGSQDYQDIIYLNQAYQQFLHNLLLNYSFLFIGFGLSDDDLDQSMAFLNSIFSMKVDNTKEYYHYALLPKRKITHLKQDWFATERGLKILEYEPDDNHTQVTEFLKSLHSRIMQTQKTIVSKPIPADFEGIRQKLRQSSFDYYKKLTGLTGRFAHLIISDLILTRMKGNLLDTNVKLNAEPEVLPLLTSLHTIWGQDNLHTVIIGAGGMGKTVSLIRLWDGLLEVNNPAFTPIPLFLALNEFNNVPEEDRNYLIKMIGRIYLGKWHLSSEDENNLRSFLNRPLIDGGSQLPRVILLLDGFNEVTADHTELIKALNELNQFAGGVQLVLTSRYDMRATFNWPQFHSLELLELTDDQIHTYLDSLPNPPPLPENRLLELVRNPMMLTLYAATSQVMQENQLNPIFEFKISIQTVGELLWNFIECQLVKSVEVTAEQDMQTLTRYLFKHLLPYIGYQLEQAGKFYLDRMELESIVNQASERFSNQEYLDTFPWMADHEDSLELGTLEAKSARKWFVKLKEKLCYELMMLVEESNQFRFLHQHFRDYFAALYVLNEMQVGLFTKQIPQILKEKPISFEVRRFMGEIEGEYENKPRLTEEGWSSEHYRSTNLGKILDLCRGKFDDIGFTVWNIVEIWKECRGELAGANLSNLNLSGIGFNNICCSRLYHQRYTATNFENSILNECNILPQGHSNCVKSAVYSEDGQKILSFSLDSTIKEWSTETGECLRTYQGHSYTVESALYSGDGKKILSASRDRTLREWSTETGDCIRVYQCPYFPFVSVVYSGDGEKFLTISEIGFIHEWSTETGECIRAYQDHSFPSGNVVYSGDGRKILSSSDNETIKEWSTETGECIRTYHGHSHWVKSTVYSGDGKKILSASDDKTIKEWNTETGECIRTYQGHSSKVESAVYSGDGKKILSASGDQTIKEWSTETGECIRTYHGHSSKVESAVYSKDGKRILSASDDKHIKEWSTETGECIRTYHGQSNSVLSLVYSGDGKKILSALGCGTIKEWSTETGECIRTYQGHSYWVGNAVYSGDGKKILSALGDGTIKEWSIETGECIRTYQGHSYWVTSAVYSRDGEKILSASDDGIIKEWSTETGECIRAYQDHPLVRSAVYSGDGKKILSISESETIKEWSTETGECIHTYQDHFMVRSAVYSEDGQKILSASDDPTIKEWSTETGECLRTYQGHSYTVESAVYSGDGQKILSTSYDKTIKEWSTETGECIQTYQDHFTVRSAVYSGDYKKILSASDDKTIKEWSTETGECLRTIENIPGLLIQGCSFKNLHPESKISDETKMILKQYGAKFE